MPAAPGKRSAVAGLAALALLLAGCGGGEDEDTSADTSGASGAEGSTAAAELTVGEFIAELQPEKQAILEGFVEQSEACRGVDVDNGFVLVVSAAAIDADQEAPLSELVEEQC